MNLFLFHRDLRIEDNTGLNALAEKGVKIGLLFIFNAQQVNAKQPNFAANSFNFMLNRLAVLSRQVKVNFIHALDEVSALKKILKHQSITAIFSNADFTPFARDRDQKTAEFCQNNKIQYQLFQDYLLFKPGVIMSKNQSLLRVFTPFWRQMIAKKALIAAPVYRSWKHDQFITIAGCRSLSSFKWKFRYCSISSNRDWHLKQIARMRSDYQTSRNFLAMNSTSKASVAIKFGVISVREVVNISIQVWKSFDNPFLRQLAWREFFYHTVCLALKQKVWQWNDNWNPRFNNLQWRNNQTEFKKWCQGTTGFRLVDAAMHQLNQTGEMHNRARLVVASFLTKNLLIDWRWGANYFQTKLIDYDPIVNMMSWQWVCGCGLDAAPYFRIFNPTLQQIRFDPQLIYCNQFNPKPNKQMIDWKFSRERYLKVMKQL